MIAFDTEAETAEIDRLRDTLAERNEEIRCLRRDKLVLVDSLLRLAELHEEDDLAGEIIAGLAPADATQSGT